MSEYCSRAAERSCGRTRLSTARFVAVTSWWRSCTVATPGQDVASSSSLRAARSIGWGRTAVRLLTYRTASRLDKSRSISLDASITKLFVSESYEVERAFRDAVGGTIYSGTSEMQRNIIARWLGL